MFLKDRLLKLDIIKNDYNPYIQIIVGQLSWKLQNALFICLC